jgi:hypothetical protein
LAILAILAILAMAERASAASHLIQCDVSLTKTAAE